MRIRLTAADPDFFRLLPADGRAGYRIGSGGDSGSVPELPLVH